MVLFPHFSKGWWMLRRFVSPASFFSPSSLSFSSSSASSSSSSQTLPHHCWIHKLRQDLKENANLQRKRGCCSSMIDSSSFTIVSMGDTAELLRPALPPNLLSQSYVLITALGDGRFSIFHHGARSSGRAPSDGKMPPPPLLAITKFASLSCSSS